jgi:hypothetical protein
MANRCVPPYLRRTALEALLQGRHVDGHLPSRLASHEEGHEESTDAVPLEIEGDGQEGARVRTWLYRDIDDGSDRPVHAAHTPLVRRIKADELSGGPSVCSSDAPRRETAIPDLGSTGILHLTADDAFLPLREATRVCGIGEHRFGRAIDLDADRDRRHLATSGHDVGVPLQVEGPSSITVDSVVERFPTRSMAIEVTVLELEARPFRGLRDEPDLDLAGVALD